MAKAKASSKSVEGARRSDMWTFWGEEIDRLECTPQIRYQELDDDHVERFITTIINGGDWPPIEILVDTITGKPRVFDGRHRVAAAKKIHKEHEKYGIPLGANGFPLRAVKASVTEEMALVLAVKMNNGLPYSAMDQAVIIQRCERFMQPAEIAKLLGLKTVAHVATKRQYCDLPEDFQAELHAGRQSESTAKALIEARQELYTDADTWRLVASSLIDGSMKPHELRAQIGDLKRAKGRAVSRGIGNLRAELKKFNSIRARRLSEWLQGNPSITPGMLAEVLADNAVDKTAIDDQLESAPVEKPARKPRVPADPNAPKKRRGRPPKTLAPIDAPDPTTIEPLDDDDSDDGPGNGQLDDGVASLWDGIDTDNIIDPDVDENEDLLRELGV